VYGSVTEAQRGGFLPEKTEGLAGSPQERSENGKYMALRTSTVHDPEGDNEYDIIPGQQLHPGPASGAGQSTVQQKTVSNGGPGSQGSSFRGGEKKVMKNTMYEDCELKTVVHPTLTSRGNQPSDIDHREGKTLCKTYNIIMTFFIAMAVLLATVALGFTILLWFKVSNPATVEDPSTTTSECSCPDTTDIDLLQGDLQDLRGDLDDVQDTYDTEILNLSENMSLIISRVEELEANYEDLRGPLAINVSFPNTSLFNCESAARASCDLPTDRNNCTASYFIRNETESSTVGAFCMFNVPEIGGGQNTLVATLLQSDDLLTCACSRMVGYFIGPAKCQLVITSCALEGGGSVVQ
jgi:hypothetical protein